MIAATDVMLAVAVVAACAAFLRWPVRALIAISLFVLFIDTLETFLGPSIRYFDELVIPLLLVITLVRRGRHLQARGRLARDLAVAAFVVLGIASSLVAGVPLTIWAAGLLLVMKGFAVFYVALLLDVEPSDVWWASKVTLVVGCVVLAIGFVELVFPRAVELIGLEAAEARAGLPATKSLFYHPQLYAWFCGFLALYLFSHFAMLRRPWMLALALLFSLGTVLAARRRAIVAVVAGVGLGLVWEAARGRAGIWRRMVPWAASASGLLVLALVFLPAFAGLYELTVERYLEGETPSGEAPEEEGAVGELPARFALYAGSVEIARDYAPLGAGLGRYGGWISRQTYSPLYEEYGLDQVHGLSRDNPQFITDTFWPQVLGEVGIGGVVAYAVFLGYVALQLWRFSRLPALSPRMRAVAIGSGLILAHTLVESIASPIFHSPPQIMLIMVAIGGVLSLDASMNDRDSTETAPA
jgi:hypothetical protein